MVKKALAVIACFAALDAFSPPAGVRLEAQGTSSLVISQVYGGGGNLGATLTHDFIEIFNRGTTAVSLAGWSVQYTSAAGTTWQVTPLSGSISPGQYYLVQQAPGAGGTTPLPTPDATGTTAMSATNAKVALVNSLTAYTVSCPAGVELADFVGYGTANCSETSPVGALTNTTAALRADAGCQDTGNNSVDFTTPAPSPRNTASPLHACGVIIDQGEAVISQVYGGGGNSGATLTHDFIEIFNPGPNAINLAGWSVQYASSTGATWQVTALAGVVAPGRYHLVQEAQGAGGTTPLPAPDSTGTIAMAGGAGKVALVRSLTALSGACTTGGDLADLVGYGAATDCFEGAGPAPTLTNTTSALRAQAGCVDSNNNQADFSSGTPTPRNSASPLNDCSPPTIVWPHDVQSALDESPLVGQIVAVQGIVTARRFNNGFFIQTPDAVAETEGNPQTSEGLFVFTSSAPTVSVGDDVVVTGTVTEFSPSADPNQPPITEIVTPTIVVQGTGQPLPTPIALTTADLSPSGGPLQLEKYEGMRVAPGVLSVVAPTAGSVNEPNGTGSNNGVFYTVFAGTPRPFREAGIDVLDPPPLCDENAASACALPVFDGNPERLRVDSDGQVGVFPGVIVSTGASINIAAGVLDYAFRTWTVLPDSGALTIVTPGFAPQGVAAPNATEYQVASMNLQRFFDTVNDTATDDPVLTAMAYTNRLTKASLIVRDSLHAPDVIGVQEAENLIVLQDLAARIDADAVAAGQPAPGYQAHLIEGNDIGGIDVGVLTRANVTVHSVEQWRPDETFINPRDGTSELLNDRPSLVLDVTVQGPADRLPAHVFVIVNHLRSLNGIDDPVDGVRVRAKRKAQGESVAQLLIQLQTENPGVPIVSVGDYNAFEVSDGYVDLLGIIRGDQAPAEQVVEWSAMGLDPDFTSAAPAGDYSYSFDGNAQTLDHVLLSSAASTALSGFGHAHIDADFPEVLRGDPGRPERLSDHDPAVARFFFPLDTTAPVFGPVSDVTEPATTFDGATVVYVLPIANDNLDAVVPVLCAPASGTFFPVGATTVTCTANDIAGNTATTSFVVTVTRSDDAGAMLGIGQVSGASRVTFTFFARQAASGAERGWLTLAASRPRGFPNTFVAVGFDEVVFLGATVRFSGRGWWNGQAGHTFLVESSDNGEPGTGRDTFAVAVRNPQGIVVLQASGLLSAGNVDKLQ
jgi:hypothetical protein